MSQSYRPAEERYKDGVLLSLPNSRAFLMRDDIGRLLLRLTVGVLILFHGLHKLLNGIAPIKTMLVPHHLPDWLAYGVYLGEVAAPLMMILGLGARLGAVLVAIDMIFAIALARTGEFFALNAAGGYALELELFFLAGAIASALLGPGRFSVGGGWI